MLGIIPPDDDEPRVGGETDEDEAYDVCEWHDVDGGAASAKPVQGGDREEAAEDGSQRVGRAWQ